MQLSEFSKICDPSPTHGSSFSEIVSERDVHVHVLIRVWILNGFMKDALWDGTWSSGIVQLY